MKLYLHQKILVFFLILLFAGGIISPVSSLGCYKNVKSVQIELENQRTGDNTTLYVGGNGPDNYSSIQDAVDNASDGFSIFVHTGLYIENIVIDKQLTIKGEDAKETTVDGSHGEFGFLVLSDNVTITKFTIVGCTGYYESGIALAADNNHIVSVILQGNREGISVTGSGNRLVGNNISDGFNGIYLRKATTTVLDRNTIIDTLRTGINVEDFSNNNTFTQNTMQSCNWYGLGIGEQSDNNLLYHNNFIANRWHAYDECSNIWDGGRDTAGNYWEDYSGIDTNDDGIGDTPYLIEGGNNKDLYPLLWKTGRPHIQLIHPRNSIYVMNKEIVPFLRPVSIGSIEIAVNAIDFTSSFSHATFYINDKLMANKSGVPPWLWEWDKRSFGRYVLKIIVYTAQETQNTEEILVWKFF